MEITILKPDEQIITLNVNPSGTVEDLKVLMQFETRLPHQLQKMLFDGKEMKNSKKLRAYGVSDGDLVVMRMADSSVSSSRISNNELGFNLDGSAVNPSAFRQYILNDYVMMTRISMNDPELADIILRDDPDWLQLFLRTRHSQRAELQRQQDEELALLYADQSDPEVGKKIEDATPHNGVIQKWNACLQHIPRYTENGKSPQVYAEVNGIPIHAMLDTGAEISVMTKSCAEECRLLRLIDRSNRENIGGVGGQVKPLGRINIAPIKIGSMFCLGSFAVMKDLSVPCIFGMDILHENQCIIDTKAGVLRIQGSEDVPFLQASESEDSNVSSSLYSSGSSRRHEFEAKVSELVELGSAKEAARYALKVVEGDEELAAEFLFGC